MRGMKRLLTAVAGFLLAVAAVVGALVLVAPWLDGPVNRIAGGPFKQASLDGRFASAAALEMAPGVELEVGLDSRPSVNVAVIVHDGVIYVPATLDPAAKRWPRAIEDNPAVRIRTGGAVFDAHASRVTDATLHATLAALGAAKYSAGYFEPERTWFFELQPVISDRAGRATTGSDGTSF